MASPVHHYSVWFASAEGTFARHPYVAGKTLAAFRRNASLFFEDRPDTYAVVVIIPWTETSTGEMRALDAEILSNGIAERRKFLDNFLAGHLAEIGLDAKGKVIGRVSEKALRKHEAKERKATRRRRKAIPGTRPTVTAVLHRISARKPPEPCDREFAIYMHFRVTPGVQTECRPADVKRAIRRFQTCDWGDVDARTARQNVKLTREPKHEAIRGVYQSRAPFWIVADPKARRAVVIMPYET